MGGGLDRRLAGGRSHCRCALDVAPPRRSVGGRHRNRSSLWIERTGFERAGSAARRVGDRSWPGSCERCYSPRRADRRRLAFCDSAYPPQFAPHRTGIDRRRINVHRRQGARARGRRRDPAARPTTDQANADRTAAQEARREKEGSGRAGAERTPASCSSGSKRPPANLPRKTTSIASKPW